MMNLRFFLIAMTLLAVVSDAMLMPFYPQFFEETFGMSNPQHVGYYIAATCFTVMFAFPFWAWVARRVPELNLLVWTQLLAGLLCIYCYWTQSLVEFWIVSLSMIVFKGSYLLIYPYVMSLEKKGNYSGTIGLLSVIVHFGSILGAILGGYVVDLYNPRNLFLIMAIGDFVQMAVSFFLIKSSRFDTSRTHEEADKSAEDSSLVPHGFIFKLGMITLVFYFSAFLIRPFFSLYWESVSVYDSEIVSGFIYAIPGVVALFALWLSHRQKQSDNSYKGIVPAMLLGLAGLFLQSAPSDLVVFLGRFVYGWAMYHAVVKYDVLLFELSTPKSYATDYSKIHFFQNLGVLIASFSAGILVDLHGLQMPFFVAAAGFIVTLLAYYFSFRSKISLAQTST
ncbi:hypothetical protein GCM10009122_58470 [Fulvivirga kasyanovii]|nr:MFS transporter [Fulvivirga kasyanovii]